MNQLLYGHNTDERIVAVHHREDGTMRLYFRETQGVRSTDEKFFPFFFVSDTSLLEGFQRKHWLKQLDGTGYFSNLCVFEEWNAMWDAVRYMIDRHNRRAVTKVESHTQLEHLYLSSDPVTQYLLQTGRTMFKGMRFDELHRLQLDIETYTSPRYRFSNAARPEDRVILIALSDNRGWEHLINGKKLAESRMLEELVSIIRERDPDVIEGHNIYSFDLPYLLKRSELCNVPLAIGRDSVVPRMVEMRAYGDRRGESSVMDIPGRHVVDTLVLVQNYDAIKREMESHGLKAAAKHFGFASHQRTYIAGDRIAWHWDNDVDPLLAYAMDDVRETGKISEHLSSPSFHLTQMLPFSYGAVTRMGSAAKIESLLVRKYLKEKHSLPKPSSGAQTTGGYTDIFVSGVVGPVLHVDVESLYPSVMLSRNIAPASDVLQVFQSLLKDLTAMRLDAKHRLRKANFPDARLTLDSLQSSLKILINSFYGYLGYFRGIFNDFQQADVVTKTGQEILRHMIDHIKLSGGKVVEVDTDGVFFIPPAGVDTAEREHEFVSGLSALFPEGIAIALDGRYRRMLSYKMKNYALLGYDQRISVKGSSLTSRAMERFGRQYVVRCIECLLQDNIEGLHKAYTDMHQLIAGKQLDIRDFARTEVLRDPLETYSADVAAGKRNRSAAYEVALSSGNIVRAGSRISYYIVGSEPNPKSFEWCKPAEAWDPNFPDQNVAYYLRRLDEFSEKFSPFFLPRDYRAIFSVDDLFPFKPQGIQSLVAELAGGQQETDEDVMTPGIWLDA
jgi:DNA polymerase elongation subunit (family B)